MRVSPGVADEYGTKLAREISISFTTGDLPPYLDLPPGAGVIEDTEKVAYPLRLLNIKSIRVALRLFPPQEAVTALSAEENRPWDQKPKAPTADEGDTKVFEIAPGAASNQVAVHPLMLKETMGPGLSGGLPAH